jgi:transcriptional regulator with XRE-family HTH domain
MKLGEKIKAERIRNRLTQAKLCDGILTRSMLSQIEHGGALPSLGTLSALATRLHVPMEYFLSEDETPFWFLKKERLPFLQEAIREGKYLEALSHWNEALGMDDELHFLFAVCLVEATKENLKIGNFFDARSHMEKACYHLEHTSYPQDSLRARILLYRALFSSVEQEDPRETLKQYEETVRNSTEEETAKYLSADLNYAYRIPYFKKHIQAKKHVIAHEYDEAIHLLRELEDGHSFTDGKHLLHLIYRDLEVCYLAKKDFEMAYTYAKKGEKL